MSDCVTEAKQENITLTGDPTGESLLYVYRSGDVLLWGQDPAHLADAIVSRGLPLTIDPFAVTSMLVRGLIAMPWTVYSEMHVAGIGDQLVCAKTDAGWELEHRLAFPYFADLSREDQLPEPKQLMASLTAAVAKRLEDGRPAVLMLSSGKDSTAVAVALARLGRRDVHCMTFVANTDQDEDGYARELCAKLRLEHERVEIPADRPVSSDLLTAYFQNAPLPCGDDCQIPYVTALQKAGAPDLVLDGSGNDVYVGHVPSRRDLMRSRLRVRPYGLASLLEAAVPVSSGVDQLLRTPEDLCFKLGQLRLREVRRFFPNASEEKARLASLGRAAAGRDVFDYRALVRGRHYDQGSCMLKAMMACAAIGSLCALPWCDTEVIDYYFNLPRSARFDAQTYSNKVLLREMLRQEVGYPDEVLGKRYFEFDRIAFFTCNRTRVRDEILNCRLWNLACAERLLDTMYNRLPRNPRVGVALNTWFLLSGWLNHNRWTTVRRP